MEPFDQDRPEVLRLDRLEVWRMSSNSNPMAPVFDPCALWSHRALTGEVRQQVLGADKPNTPAPCACPMAFGRGSESIAKARYHEVVRAFQFMPGPGHRASALSRCWMIGILASAVDSNRTRRTWWAPGSRTPDILHGWWRAAGRKAVELPGVCQATPPSDRYRTGTPPILW
jgi:hypothetical protein